MRCQALVAKGSVRTRISMLENELANAINDKEAMDQVRVCQPRDGAEEARLGTMENRATSSARARSASARTPRSSRRTWTS